MLIYLNCFCVFISFLLLSPLPFKSWFSSFLISLHLVQASIWALLYLLLPGVTEFQTFEKAVYFSLVTFTTLGYGEITIESGNRILAGLEAVNGIILIGWSTAFMFFVYQEILKVGEQMPGSGKSGVN